MCYTLKTKLIISALFLSQLVFGQIDSNYSFKLLRLKDALNISYDTKVKEFYKAISFRDSTTKAFQTNKRTDWAKSTAPVGFSYYGWEGFACYDKLKDTAELCKTRFYNQQLLSYASFIDLNNDRTVDIIFSNIYDQFIKTQSNWTDIYFNVKGKYISIMLKGYLINLTKKNQDRILIKTVEQPINKEDSQFVIHCYEIDTQKMTSKEIATQNINKQQVKQSE